MSQPTRPGRVPGRLTYLTYRAAGTALAHLPEPAAAAAANAGALVMTVLARRPAAMYARHLRRVVGGQLSDAEVRAWTRRAFRNYARYWMEGARLPRLAPSVVESRFVVESGFEYLQQAMAAGNGAIVALPHVGSWEWGGAWLALHGYPMTSVAEPLAPPELYEWFVAQREAIGLSIVPLGPHAGNALLRVLDAGGLVGLLCDRDLLGNGVEVEFFGERTTLPAGPATLALRTGAHLLPTAVYSGPGRDHTAVVLPPVSTQRTGRLRQDVVAVTQRLAHDLERLIRRAPEQWHLFQPNWPSDRHGPDRGTARSGESGSVDGAAMS